MDKRNAFGARHLNLEGFRVEGIVTFDEIAYRLGDTVDARSRLQDWGWQASANRIFACDGPPFGEAGWIDIGVHLFALYSGLGSARLLGLDRPSQVAVAIAGSQKSLPVALVVYTGYFQSAYPLAVLPLIFYHVGQLILDTFIADSFRWRTEHEPRVGQQPDDRTDEGPQPGEAHAGC